MSTTDWKQLKTRVPDELIKQRKQGSSTLSYVPWYHVCDLLDERAPGWTVEIRELGEIGSKIYLRVALTIDGVTRENLGIEEEDKKGYGDAFTSAYSMAIRRAAALFGIARHLYDKDDMAIHQREQRQERHAAQLKAVPPTQAQGAPVDGWKCSDATKRSILDLEAELEAAGIPQKYLRDKLEIQLAARNPAHLAEPEAQRYVNWLRNKLEANRSKTA